MATLPPIPSIMRKRSWWATVLVAALAGAAVAAGLPAPLVEVARQVVCGAVGC